MEGVSVNHSWDCEVYQTAAAMISGIDLKVVDNPVIPELALAKNDCEDTHQNQPQHRNGHP
jgi:hypothetical protein